LSDKLITVFTFEVPEEAVISKGILEASGISSVIEEDTESEIFAGWLNLNVKKRDFKRAREILKEALVIPSTTYKFWDKWMVMMGAGWGVILLGIFLMLFTGINNAIGVVIITAGAILAIAGFIDYGKGEPKES
jgi:hypothetical protein